MMKANDAMPLDGPRNLRDLGGYPTIDGKRTRMGQFLRSDSPASLTLSDCERLYQYGVRTQVDLRSALECRLNPSPLDGYRDMAYHNVQLLDSLSGNSGSDGPHMLEMPDTMAPVYMHLLAHAKPGLTEALRLMLRLPEGCALFNCTAGKDRTGVVALLLLKAARCPDEVIIADYAASYGNIQKDLDKIIDLYRQNGTPLNPSLLRSDPELMEQTLQAFDREYGAIENWMALAGFSDQELDALRTKLVG
ncbi:MAG: tyrosine-protein phosphatase [Clostridia bacterium]|nr:tyrosine-protein phosphatase [Clostridia bacterium]